MNLEKMRMESDSIGEMEVPVDAYYGVQSLRAKQNFPITGNKLHPLFIQNLAKIKKAAALTNRSALRLPVTKASAIIKACDEIVEGKFRDEFIVDAIQGGAGTSANMNINEEEWKLFNSQAQKLGLSQSEFIRQAVFTAKVEVTIRPVYDSTRFNFELLN